MIKVIERATNKEFKAKHIEGGYEIYKGLELYKKLKESTFKKYFKLTGESVEADTEKKTEPESTKDTEKKTAKSKQKQTHQELNPEKREHMVEKIKKMLSLAENNPSIEEGLAAALQAQKLMAKYNIHEDEVTLEEIKDDIASVFSEQKHNAHLMAWRKALAAIIARNFRCKTYLSGRDVVFRGYKKDAEIALEVYLSLYSIGHSLGSKAYADQKDSQGTGKGAYNSFIAGFLSGVEEGLDVQCTALMIVVPKEVEEEFSEFSATFRTSKTSLRSTDSELFRKGKAEGKAAVKGRAIEKKGGKKK